MTTKKTNKRNGTSGNKFSSGAFVMWCARLKSLALKPEDVRDMALAAGLPESIVPEYAGDRAIVSRVLDRNASKLKRQGYVLAKLKRTQSHVLMTLHEADKDIDARETELPQVGTVEWQSEDANNAITSDTGHPVADVLNSQYQELRDKISSTDWTTTLVAYLQDECYAQSWREDGRVYWVPPAGLQRVKELQDWLSVIGVSLAIAEIDTAVKDSVVEVVETSLVDQLDELEAEVESFNGLQKPSTYVDRIEQYHNLRKRVVVHTESLGIAKETADSLLERLEEMESVVEDHLEERKQIRVKRDGTIERIESL